MTRAALVKSVPEAIRTMKAMGAQGFLVGEDYREAARKAVAAVLYGRMEARVSSHLEAARCGGLADRRNGSYRRHVLTECGDVELEVPRTRHFNPIAVVRAYARRAAQVDRLILICFLLGLSTRKVAEALLPVLGERISPATVSQIAKQLDTEVEAFHRRKLVDRYRVLMFDGVVIARKTGAGAIRRPVLVVLGVDAAGKKEVIDFRQAPAESQPAWEAFLNGLHQRGLAGERAELIVVDGGAGLLAALPLVYPHVPVQRCWAHKMRNILDKAKKKDREPIKRDLHRIMNADNKASARKNAGRFAQRWGVLYPKALACLKADLDELLTFFAFDDPDWRKRSRTTNAIERCFVEVRRRARPMGVMADRTSVERILYAVFSIINKGQGIATPFPLTHNS